MSVPSILAVASVCLLLGGFVGWSAAVSRLGAGLRSAQVRVAQAEARLDAERAAAADRVQALHDTGTQFPPRAFPGDVADYVAKSITQPFTRYQVRLRLPGSVAEQATRVPPWCGILEAGDDRHCLLELGAKVGLPAGDRRQPELALLRVTHHRVDLKRTDASGLATLRDKLCRHVIRIVEFDRLKARGSGRVDTLQQRPVGP